MEEEEAYEINQQLLRYDKRLEALGPDHVLTDEEVEDILKPILKLLGIIVSAVGQKVTTREDMANRMSSENKN